MADGSLETQPARSAAESAAVRSWELDSPHVLPTRFWALTPLLPSAYEMSLIRSTMS